MKEKTNIWLPVLLMLAFALSRWPGLMPPNFSAAYALAFCAGVFFPRRLAWWLPLATLAISDVALNFYYYFHYHTNSFNLVQLANYATYGVIIWLGGKFSPQAHLIKLISGGVLGAILFYIITNTAAWFFNPFHHPEYTKTLAGWIKALTTGTAGWPQTWEFFRNTLLSGGLFTGLFVGAMKYSASAESAREKELAEETGEERSPHPEEAKPEEAKA